MLKPWSHKKPGTGGNLTWSQSEKPPKTEFFKVNMDASTGRDGRKAVGVVVRDSKGDIMAAACRSFRANWAVERVEAYAVFYALRICWQAGLRMMELKTDSKQVADALNGRTSIGRFYNFLSNQQFDNLFVLTLDVSILLCTFFAKSFQRVLHTC